MVHSIGSIIKLARQNKNMTQEELAGRLGITPQAVSKWERDAGIPDIGMIGGICRSLEISADVLLGLENPTESKEQEDNQIIMKNLRQSFEPLELLLGYEVVPLFLEHSYTGRIMEMRKKLAVEGILVPVVRIRDTHLAEKNEIIILASERLLYQEQLESSTWKLEYIVEQLEKIIREKYRYILSPDITRTLVENLRMEYPALIEGVVPERLSYHRLTDILKAFIEKGNSTKYIRGVIETAERMTRNGEQPSTEEIAERCTVELAEDNFWIYLGKKPGRI